MSERAHQAIRIARLRRALQKIADLPLRDDLPQNKYKEAVRSRVRKIAIAALKEHGS